MDKVNRVTRFCSRVLLPSLFAFAHSAEAQKYPSKPIRMVVPFTAGSGADVLARFIGPKLYEAWGQQVVIDNRGSAGGTVAGIAVATAAPDGYTLLFTSSSFAGSAALYEKLPYDSIRDFAGVSLIGSAYQVLVAAPSLNIKTAKELIALSKQKPKQLSFGSAGIGSGMHYAGELFNYSAGISAVHVPYKGTADALNDVISGRTQYAFPPLPAALPLVKGGRLTLLAVATGQRVPQLPDVPTVAESGLPGYEYAGWYGVLAPAKMPRAIIMQLNKELGRIIETPDMRDKLSATGAVPRHSTPEGFEKIIRDEIETRRKVFKAAGVKAE